MCITKFRLFLVATHQHGRSFPNRGQVPKTVPTDKAISGTGVWGVRDAGVGYRKFKV